jgi:hypothetical protein
VAIRRVESASHQRRWRLLRVFQLAAVALVAALLALLGWRLAADGRGSTLVSEIRAGKKPSAPPFDLRVIWPYGEMWPAGVRPALGDGRIALRELREHPS